MTQARKSKLLWTVQGVLAALFLFAGVMKLIAPAELLKGPVPLPVLFLRIIGVFEVLGAIGLVVPGLARVRVDLTPLAAAGLVTIMAGATVITIEGGALAGAAVPFVVGLLAATVALGRASLLSRSINHQV
jgi:uncharacterized membrane protein